MGVSFPGEDVNRAETAPTFFLNQPPSIVYVYRSFYLCLVRDGGDGTRPPVARGTNGAMWAGGQKKIDGFLPRRDELSER
jgi:hypothetical protein